MTDDRLPSPAPIPADDLSRSLAVARPDQDPSLPHIGLVGDTYTILIGGEDTAGKYTLIDMHVPPGGGPPPHRHDFEEMFTVLDGEVEVTFRGATMKLTAGETVNVPANAPHSFPTWPSPRPGCCACALRQDRTSSSPWSAKRSRRGPRHRQRSTTRNRRPSSPRPRHWHRNSAPN